jgi:hypothetical protein
MLPVRSASSGVIWITSVIGKGKRLFIEHLGYSGIVIVKEL